MCKFSFLLNPVGNSTPYLPIYFIYRNVVAGVGTIMYMALKFLKSSFCRILRRWENWFAVAGLVLHNFIFTILLFFYRSNSKIVLLSNNRCIVVLNTIYSIISIGKTGVATYTFTTKLRKPYFKLNHILYCLLPKKQLVTPLVIEPAVLGFLLFFSVIYCLWFRRSYIRLFVWT